MFFYMKNSKMVSGIAVEHTSSIDSDVGQIPKKSLMGHCNNDKR